MTIPYPPSIELAHLPTPLRPLERLSEKLGVEVLCKRDDLTGVELSGNKVRKLEFFFAEALAQQCVGVITCGAAQSNHARATAVAAARLGLGCHLLLRVTDPADPPLPTGNLLLERAVGATIEWIDEAAYEQRDALMAARADEMQGAQLIIPEGGSDALGAWGYVRCLEELANELGDRPATIVFAVGSGGTAAGLLAGCRLLGLPYRLVGVCVAPDRDGLQKRIAKIVGKMARRHGVDVAIDPEGIELWDYSGSGYGLSQPEELAHATELARLEGLFVDPVYTGKALHGLITELSNGRKIAAPIVFLHTGGIFSLFADTRLADQL